jgi:hypothetical protein
VEFCGSLRDRIMSSAKRDTLTISLSTYIPFICSSCLIALTRNFRTMLNRCGESRLLCLVLALGNWFQFFPIKYDVDYRFVIYNLYNVELHFFCS